MYQLYEGQPGEGLPANLGVRACVGVLSLTYLIMVLVAALTAPPLFTVTHGILVVLLFTTMATTCFFFAAPENYNDICFLSLVTVLSSLVIALSSTLLSVTSPQPQPNCSGIFRLNDDGTGLCLFGGCPDGSCVRYYNGHGMCTANCGGASGDVSNGTKHIDEERLHDKWNVPQVPLAVYLPHLDQVDRKMEDWNTTRYGMYGGTYYIGEGGAGTVAKQQSDDSWWDGPTNRSGYSTLVTYVLKTRKGDGFKTHLTGFSLSAMAVTSPPLDLSSSGQKLANERSPLRMVMAKMPVRGPDLAPWRVRPWATKDKGFDSVWLNNPNKTAYAPGMTNMNATEDDKSDKLSYLYLCPKNADGSNRTCAADEGPWYLSFFIEDRKDYKWDKPGVDFVFKTTKSDSDKHPLYMVDENLFPSSGLNSARDGEYPVHTNVEDDSSSSSGSSSGSGSS